MFLLTSIEHAFATAASDVVKMAKYVEAKVLPALQKVEADAPTIEAITSLISPQAANIERVGFAILGSAIKAIQDAEAAGNAGGVNIALDATVVADIKSIIPTIKAQAVLAAAGTGSMSVPTK